MYLVMYREIDESTGIVKGDYLTYVSGDEEQIIRFLDNLSYKEFQSASVMRGEFLEIGRNVTMKPRGDDETAS